ncbi:aspartate/tyrosine/aromatic aminotransferase [Bacillus thuringiensis]|uniref:Aminotransferase class I/II-fold pyridoxal phosphate-dependent enzyme n=1 Tax=Bacillus cereus TaxID=1396 RepID=A0AAN6B9T6_BACCE|nr:MULTISPECIES: aminotransferase class I/II-fold pyridoxal phosphate-dependent enzyme [Bacillus]AUB62917.1 aspartate/tyrosine/aromatic aminotransferase [Bacillus cereus]KAB2453711.1 aminotransferase class I/II-fold pyridoxal phosphate-dependent enzyme [Bacillus cereus]KAB2488700.1 aminotransferase class I/II-fold pyridoxal phosphate-dependent enzyme [Bacillus cereus]MCU4711608.1 aminotransferase class I/II-fold pyridoxal phosphate-dependent enzyme [Bacillus cereus]MCU4957960.1 aminotransferas
MSKFTNLTRYEEIGLNQDYNLADGHAHQGQSETQKSIISELSTIFYESELTKQKVLEKEFQYEFYKLAGQHSAIDHPRTMLCYSASLSTDLIATYLQKKNMTVSLLQPCFDNLATILKRRNVELSPVSEDAFSSINLETTLDNITTDALFLTLPNNPTGFMLTQGELETVIKYCKKNNKLLIIDCTFRFYHPDSFWDQYKMLEDLGVSYFVVEDTGKTFPTQDLKCSILAASEDLYEDILELHNDILLNVSPFILNLLIKYMKDMSKEGFQSTLWDIINTNRKYLRKVLENSILVPYNSDTIISVEWLQIVNDDVNSLDLLEEMRNFGLGVLPGDHFYWNNPEIGERYIRIALARNPEMFKASCDVLAEFLTATRSKSMITVGV